MQKKLLTLAILLTLTSAQAHAQSAVQDAVNKIINTIQTKIGSSAEFQSKFCRKASATSGVFSIRSLGGIACDDKFVAAMAVKTCKGYEDFDNSQCAKKAEANLGPEGMANPDAVMTEIIKTRGGQATALLCSKVDKLPASLKSLANKSCAGIAIPQTGDAPAAQPKKSMVSRLGGLFGKLVGGAR